MANFLNDVNGTKFYKPTTTFEKIQYAIEPVGYINTHKVDPNNVDTTKEIDISSYDKISGGSFNDVINEEAKEAGGNLLEKILLIFCGLLLIDIVLD